VVSGSPGQQHLLFIENDFQQYVLVESGFEHLFSGSEPFVSKVCLSRQ
jgi:hypothetical protein